MRWRVWIERIDTHNLVIGARRQICVIGGETNGMDRARMVTHGGQLGRPFIVGIARIEYGLCRPDPNVAILVSVSVEL